MQATSLQVNYFQIKTNMTRRSKKLSKKEQDEMFEEMVPKTTKSKNDVSAIHVDVKYKTENQKNFAKLIKEKEITIAAGYAGTGKTFLSCVEALKLLKTGKYHKIVLIKSVTELKGEGIGFLKGTMEEKMFPFMFSFKTNLYKIIGKEHTEALEAGGFIEILPLAYIRGMNIDNSIVIVDEAQNISLDNMKTIMTRIGTNSKMIILGDSKQIDLLQKKESSLDRVFEKFKDKEAFGTIRFEKDDQVRNPLINLIEESFDELESVKK